MAKILNSEEIAKIEKDHAKGEFAYMSIGDLLATIKYMEQGDKAYRETSEEIQRAYLQTHQERHKMNEALVKIAKMTKLDAFAFNESAAAIYEIALTAMGVDSIRLD